MLSAIDLHKVLIQYQEAIPSFSDSEKSLRRKYNQFDFDQLETERIFHRDTIKKRVSTTVYAFWTLIILRVMSL